MQTYAGAIQEVFDVYCVLFDIVMSGKFSKYPLENKKNERMGIDNEDDALCGVEGAGGSGRKYVCLYESMFIIQPWKS